MNGKDLPRLVFTTDVNGTTTPENTFGELVRSEGLYDRMANLMTMYTTGRATFSEALPQMRELAASVDRERLEGYARKMALFPGVRKTLDRVTGSRNVRAYAALSTTGFAGLMALVNKYLHGGRLAVAGADVLVDLLSPEEKKCICGFIASEEDKVRILDGLIEKHEPHQGLVFHVGDTLGDFPGLVHAAAKGGLGIAFCPNQPLKERIDSLEKDIRKNIACVHPKADIGPDYGEVLDIVEERVRKTVGVKL